MNINVKLHEDFTAEIVEKLIFFLQESIKLAQKKKLGESLYNIGASCGMLKSLSILHLIEESQVTSVMKIVTEVLSEVAEGNLANVDFSITRERIRLVIDG